MNFQEAEKTFKELRAQYAAGRLSDADFEAEVSKLRLQDNQGRWWQLGVQSGEWYMHDGQNWVKARPPATAPVSQPGTAPEGADTSAGEAAASQSGRARVLPARLFSAAPPGREGGLPVSVIIVIVAVVALVGAAIVLGAYFFLSGPSATVRATTTPTRAVAVLPTLGLPTPLPTLAPPDTPALLPATPVVTATVPLPPTRTSAPSRPTPTRTPAGSPTPAPSRTPNVPPGVYAVKLQVDPAYPALGDVVGFTLSLLNTTGGVQHYAWIIKVYQCPEQCENFKNSYGESPRVESDVVPGTVNLVAPKHISLGVGRCDYIAIPHYIDPVSQAVVPFPATQGNAIYYNITLCR